MNNKGNNIKNYNIFNNLLKLKIFRLLNNNIKLYQILRSKNIIKYYKLFLFIICQLFVYFSYKYKYLFLKIALCTMGKQENLYVKEFINYYRKLGIDKIYIYDDNDFNTEKINDIIDPLTKNFVKVYENIKFKIKNQSDAFTDCYNKNKNKFDWFLMVDMDEFLVIVNDSLKNYLLNPVFKKCDFIKIHWVIPSDNNLLYYDNRSLFERFKGPYKKSTIIKSLIKGNINNLKYWVHSPYYSPKRNNTCNNIGNIIRYKNINFEAIQSINIKKAYIVHFSYKSTEEFIKKYKRGYSNWFGKRLNKWLKSKIRNYFRDNQISKEKIE